jgi:hypothetical protein
VVVIWIASKVPVADFVAERPKKTDANRDESSRTEGASKKARGRDPRDEQRGEPCCFGQHSWTKSPPAPPHAVRCDERHMEKNAHAHHASGAIPIAKAYVKSDEKRGGKKDEASGRRCDETRHTFEDRAHSQAKYRSIVSTMPNHVSAERERIAGLGDVPRDLR